jgi:RNA polymerase sigma factor (sigma-70 family)
VHLRDYLRPSVPLDGEGRGIVIRAVRGPQEGVSPVSPRPSALPLRRYDLDLAVLEDEQLVVLAQECGYVPARDELICRCNCLKDRLIRRHAAHRGLQQADQMDAQQDAVLWIMEAIQQYRTDEQVKPRGCRFRTFLYRVLLSRFADSLRSRRRRQARLRLGGYTFFWPGQPTPPHSHGGPAGLAGGGGDPQRGMEQDELMSRLRQELERLGGLARELWDLLVRGVRLRDIARTLELSYDAVKRHRRALLARLRACLGKEYCT